MNVDVGAIVNQILAEAAAVGGVTWQKIQTSAPFFVRGYVQVLADVAEGVAKHEISKSDGKMIVQNARILLDQGIANTSQIILSQVQKFINSVISTLKSAINGALPIPVL